MSYITPRQQREKYHFVPNILKLKNAKNIFYRYSKIPIDSINEHFFLKNNCTQNLHEKLSYYLHFLIMFKSHQHLHQFLDNHHQKYGSYATQFLVNFPLLNLNDKNIITPLMCCMLWSCNTKKLRTLISWGADESQFDVYGKYGEELYSHLSYYINHMSYYICPNLICLGIRHKSDFHPMITELAYISGEYTPPFSWTKPLPFLNFQKSKILTIPEIIEEENLIEDS